ncbi:MAG: hypothetical protein RLZZ591_598 [Pseudomonadota bacterium]|jgi:putative ubiquitin-RnfH superfamily antitoxin RatB of RatAB toxin-antitoxin module
MMTVCLVYAPAPRQVRELVVNLLPGSTIAQALKQSGILATYADFDVSQADVGVWGRKAGLQTVLNADDRVEIYRPLTVDPKVARRERFARQGAKTTGLFAKRRPGAKAGY